jgi:hypothetical protein
MLGWFDWFDVILSEKMRLQLVTLLSGFVSKKWTWG